MESKKISVVVFSLLLIIGLGSLVSAVPDSPSISLSIINYEPGLLTPGDSVTVWLKVENKGVADANDLVIKFDDSYPFKLLSENQRTTKISNLESGTSYLIVYKVNIDSTAPQGAQNIQIEYSMSNSDALSVRKLPLQLSLTESPIALTSVRVTPETLSPGSKSKLTIGIKNLAKSSTIRDLTVSLGLTPVVSSTSILIDLPFVPINGGSQKIIDKVVPGQTTAFEFEISTYPNAESKLYKVPLSLSYKDETGKKYNQTMLIGLEVNAKPEVLVTLDDSDITSENLEGEISITVTNKGISDIKLLTINIGKSDNYEITSTTNEIYLGNINSDDFETARFNIIANESGTISIPVMLHFKDSLNNNYNQKYELEYKIRSPPNQGNNSVVIIVIILIIIIGGIILFRRNKKRRQHK